MAFFPRSPKAYLQLRTSHGPQSSKISKIVSHEILAIDTRQERHATCSSSRDVTELMEETRVRIQRTEKGPLMASATSHAAKYGPNYWVPFCGEFKFSHCLRLRVSPAQGCHSCDYKRLQRAQRGHEREDEGTDQQVWNDHVYGISRDLEEEFLLRLNHEFAAQRASQQGQQMLSLGASAS